VIIEIKKGGILDLMVAELNSLARLPSAKGLAQRQQAEDGRLEEKAEEKKPSILEQILIEVLKPARKGSKDLEKKVSKGRTDGDVKEQKPVPSPEEDYFRHTEIYRQFHADYLKSTTPANSIYDFYSAAETTREREFSWGEEVISYRERKELVRKMQMNALMQGGHNNVDPGAKERYEFWKYTSKFNLLMSFMMYERALSGG